MNKNCIKKLYIYKPVCGGMAGQRKFDDGWEEDLLADRDTYECLEGDKLYFKREALRAQKHSLTLYDEIRAKTIRDFIECNFV